MARWRELHPDWTHKLWHDDGPTAIVYGAERIESRWPDLLRRACHQAQRSNIWRVEVVLRQGGVYIDTDMEPLANIESAIGDRDAFATSQWRGASCCACFGARPGHPWIEDAVQNLASRDPTVSLSMGARCFDEVYARHRTTVYQFPRTVFIFYPHRDFAVTDRLVVPETLALHRWSCFWYPTGYVPI